MSEDKKQKSGFNKAAGFIKARYLNDPFVPIGSGGGGLLGITLFAACFFDGGVSLLAALMTSAGGLTIPAIYIGVKHSTEVSESRAGQRVKWPLWARSTLETAQNKILKIYASSKTDDEKAAEARKLMQSENVQEALKATTVIDRDGKKIEGEQFKFVSKTVKKVVVTQVLEEPAEIVGEAPAKKAPKVLEL